MGRGYVDRLARCYLRVNRRLVPRRRRRHRGRWHPTWQRRHGQQLRPLNRRHGHWLVTVRRHSPIDPQRQVGVLHLRRLSRNRFVQFYRLLLERNGNDTNASYCDGCYTYIHYYYRTIISSINSLNSVRVFLKYNEASSPPLCF